jgi:hypothetical protein
MASEQAGNAQVKVISGGQTGADLAGLRAARDLGLETGGFAAAGFWNEDGAQPGLGPEFGLVEAKGSYVHRTKLNVDAADCTVAFLAAERGSGTSKTVGYALTGKWTDGFASSAQGCYCYRPVLVISGSEMEDTDACALKLQTWLAVHGARKRRLTLNVAGHRTSLAKSLGLAFDYDRRCYDILQLALKQMALKVKPARKGTKRTREEPEPLVHEHELVHT